MIASTQRFPKLSLSGAHLSEETLKVFNGDVTDESTFLRAVRCPGPAVCLIAGQIRQTSDRGIPKSALVQNYRLWA